MAGKMKAAGGTCAWRPQRQTRCGVRKITFRRLYGSDNFKSVELLREGRAHAPGVDSGARDADSGKRHPIRRASPGYRHQSAEDRKSTRLNSSHQIISYAVFCLKKKKNKKCDRL